MGFPAARITDNHLCPMITPGTPPVPHVGGIISGPGVPLVLIGGIPAAVMGDLLICVGPPDSIVEGSPMVLIGGKPAAFLSSKTAHGGAIVAGFPTVLIGNGAAIDLAAILPFLPQATLDMILLSPTLTAQIIALHEAGWTFEEGPAGGGTYADRTTHTITIDHNKIASSEATTVSLSHEAGHAAFIEEPYISDAGLTRAEFVDQNTSRNLHDEGAATLNNCQVRDEIQQNGGPDIGLSGNQANAPDYDNAFQEYQRTGDSEAARDTIGNIYGHGESPSGAENVGKDYTQYYGENYGTFYDAHHTP